MEAIAYACDPDTREYTGQVPAQYSPLEQEKILLPANALFAKPPECGEHEIAVATTDFTAWTICADWRGIDLYKTDSKAVFQLEKSHINVVPANVGATPLIPGVDDKWSGSDWVFDQLAYNARLVAEASGKRNQLLIKATSALAPLQDAADLGVATDEEKALRLAWMQYRVALIRIEQQSGYPSEIAWPELPQ